MVDLKRARILREYHLKKAEEDSYQAAKDVINKRRAIKGLRVTEKSNDYMIDFVKRSGILGKLKTQLADQIRIS